MKVKSGPGGPGDVVFRTFKDGKAGLANANAKSESLGTQSVDGLNAEGTRITRTIPAGEIGNEQQITVVSERWYSADLQMDVKSTHSDPRFGNTTYTLTNIQRTEQPATLFAVPSDYTIEQGHRGSRPNKRGASAPQGRRPGNGCRRQPRLQDHLRRTS